MSERDEAQGARRAEHETYQLDRRVGEHRATQQFACVAFYPAFPYLNPVRLAMIKLEAVYTLALAWLCLSFSANASSETSLSHHLHPSHIKTLAASCSACHGSHGNSLGITPMLAGLNKQYFIGEMLTFKLDTKSSTVMHRHAKGLTNEEIVLLAEYFSKQTRTMPAKLKSKPLEPAHD